MKKIVKSVCVVLSCVLCLCCVGGCKGTTHKDSDDVTPNDVMQALKNAGFEKTYFEDSKVYVDDTGIYLYGGELFEGDINYMTETTSYKLVNSGYYSEIFIRGYSNIEDTVSIINAVVPLWDNSFDNYGEKAVSELSYQSYFSYNNISFSIENKPTPNENYMSDLNDHNKYNYEEIVKIHIK